MKIISFIERCQADVIERILRHCGLWEGPVRTLARARASPNASPRTANAPRELECVPDGEFRESRAEASRELQLLFDPEFL